MSADAIQETDEQSAEQSAAEMSARERDHYELIQELERRCEILEQDYETKNARSEAGKKDS